MPALATKLSNASAPATIAMSIRARALRAAGHDVISLALGEPDFATPTHVIDAAHAAALDGQTKYPPVDGTLALKQAVVAKFARENDLDYALNEVMVANGGKQILFNALMATLDPGDEVVIPAPYWASYPLTVELLGGVPVFAECLEADCFRLKPEALERAIGPRTKWVILNFPNNPTGAVCPADDLRALGKVLLRHPDLWILCDEIYEHLVFRDVPHVSLACAVPALHDRILTLSGVSKSYAMTGWRIGYAAGPASLIKAMLVIQSNATSGASSVSQAAAVAALNGPQELLPVMRDTYRRRRDLVVEALRSIPGMTCAMPDGAFYAYPGIAGCLGRTSAGGKPIRTDDDFALALLDEQHVAVVSGSAFGMSPYLRLSVAADDESLAEACRRIARFCADMR
ncbi:pyridoxal phosphate-dependent aminotransferase [Lichenicola cladoniae]|uniref:Aminotransferase n=1 Tax=Lichenicola cladoniae TaxID=1484109 RepID=A0A6M8HR62_9PROT|nr:pyridoxal phosphate-dependent aminotransferase [Lichenicola cladoniae]NPD68799.1 pyridoxal phosphate-dependent aminotransferase [Acetobacteraceae bacterium]QKE90780.1 pyridoxal phosphate-dependent aminotransferase [Lichenicola cladoniae]